ncbi:hypothetical protein WN48_06117 [Eufriesea mexicana]|nr:hypothetical protein WN48_06117 [Eufriesea mexicana]
MLLGPEWCEYLSNAEYCRPVQPVAISRTCTSTLSFRHLAAGRLAEGTSLVAQAKFRVTPEALATLASVAFRGESAYFVVSIRPINIQVVVGFQEMRNLILIRVSCCIHIRDIREGLDVICFSYFSSPRNGYPPGLDPRFPAFKTAATPFVGLMAPLGAPQPSTVSTTSPLSNKDPKEQKQDSLFGNPMFPPMLDMSSTQTLLHMMRTANAAQNAAELETYLKGANKRDAGVTSPLDLSSPGGFAPRKRQRTETRRSGSVSPKPKATPRPTTPPPVRCPSLCGHMPCGDGQAVNRWTIEDVVNYVSSIDICAEYAQLMQIGYSSCGILQFVSRIDSIKIPAVYDVRPEEESLGETCRAEARVSTARVEIPLDTTETSDVQLRVQQGETAPGDPLKAAAVRLPHFQRVTDATAPDRWLLTRR